MSDMKKKLPVLIIALAAALAVVILAATFVVPLLARRASVEEQFRIAAEYIAEMDYDSALLAFDRVLEIDPKNVEAQIKIADIYLAKEEPEAALQALQAALQASSPPAFALTLMRVVDELIVGSDILTVLEEAGILDELPVEEILSALVSAVGEG